MGQPAVMLLGLVAASASSPYRNLGRCGARGRWGEALDEKLFFLKTTKTAGSSIRCLFARFARSERLAVLRSKQPGGILFPAGGSTQEWVPARAFAELKAGVARPRSNRDSRYDVAYDHSTLDVGKLRHLLPGARWITASREVEGRVASAIALFKNEMSAAAYFGGCGRSDGGGLCAGQMSALARDGRNNNRIWNSVAWQMGAKTPPYALGRPLAETAAKLARAPTARLEAFVEGDRKSVE